MRPLTRWPFALVALVVLLLRGALSPPPPAPAQTAWAAEPTYRYAGHYEGDWSAALEVESSETTDAGAVFEQQAGELRGTVALDVACDGSVSGQAAGQSATAPAFAALATGDQGPRVLSARLDVVIESPFAGTLASRAAEGTASKVDLAVDGALRDLPVEVESVAAPVPFQRWYSGAGAVRLALQEGAPGRLAGDLDGRLDLGAGSGQYDPSLRPRLRGRWVAGRAAVALCPWRGDVVVSGAFGDEQLQSERLELTFQPTGDGQLEGEGRGEAAISGGTPGGCEYAGGGSFAVLVSGEAQQGRFRLRLDDGGQPQLLLTTSCPGGRYVSAQTLLTPLFGALELPESPGASAHLDLPPTQPDIGGSLDISIAPVDGAAPP
ncbi:MAG TPA: hypothetical protein VK066_31495 [Chloroflexota bacterium]|nr:hypothetical protein [Chloroflexota bacterium]